MWGGQRSLLGVGRTLRQLVETTGLDATASAGLAAGEGPSGKVGKCQVTGTWKGAWEKGKHLGRSFSLCSPRVGVFQEAV